MMAAASPMTVPAPSASDPSKKTITIGVTGAFNAFSVADTGNTASGGVSLQELWLQSLVTSAYNSPAPEARIAVSRNRDLIFTCWCLSGTILSTFAVWADGGLSSPFAWLFPLSVMFPLTPTIPLLSCLVWL